MAQFWAPSFWAPNFWAPGFWAGSATATPGGPPPRRFVYDVETRRLRRRAKPEVVQIPVVETATTVTPEAPVPDPAPRAVAQIAPFPRVSIPGNPEFVAHVKLAAQQVRLKAKAKAAAEEADLEETLTTLLGML